MISTLGMVLIMFAGTMFGFQQAARYTDRTAQLRQLIHALQRLETEIGYGQTPLPEALERSAGHIPGPVPELFRNAASRLVSENGLSFRECWEGTLEAGWGRTAMRQSEKSSLSRLGAALGISDREDQLKHLRLAMLQIQTEEETAREEQARYSKMWKSLGVLAAALVVILIV
ncbi:stage III sporulation protein SpoIIIAB [Paenibacillus tarimensis]|uniref:stage III sporulation protein SpoIIIAB n=1 Tax=Paenibacillus tarimensis TaxID=416012 RepID=UPI001F2962EE|nr:stage III sporulation protein SpoIIIAB [Paenibacillus tarimensis]MCF2942428.1 stage III sporulation protein AB [Paenibacillus tarimensis]